jgi:hypothetical protein
MSSWTESIPADELAARSREVRPGRVVQTVIAAIGVAIGWTVGRFFRSIGWAAGRTWLIGAYFAETVVYGFREGAGLPQPALKEPEPGAKDRVARGGGLA